MSYGRVILKDKDKFEDMWNFKEAWYFFLDMSDIDGLGIKKIKWKEKGVTGSKEDKENSRIEENILVLEGKTFVFPKEIKKEAKKEEDWTAFGSFGFDRNSSIVYRIKNPYSLD